MGSNTNLIIEITVKLIKFRDVVCPNCNKSILVSRYSYKHNNTEYKCPTCGELYHPCKLI